MRWKTALNAFDITFDITFDGLDSTAPLVADSLEGYDVQVGATTGKPNLYAEAIAPLPDGAPDATAESCAEAIDRNGTWAADAVTGARFCLTTTEGRYAHLRVLTAPPRAPRVPSHSKRPSGTHPDPRRRTRWRDSPCGARGAPAAKQWPARLRSEGEATAVQSPTVPTAS
ncbi:hypothetical protein ABZX75_19350 [Streptomyces sp. NPDC003038]|uniref:hypothetical protein n=1 Tax=unclassified Streptomyces TaxID=2593676 RepID=UPI0033A6F7DF